MKLTNKQKDHLLALIAEGLQSDEINLRAAKFKPPFSVSRQQVDFYRDSRGVVLQEIKDASESDALRTGLALREERVETLVKLADKLKAELLGDLLWVERQRALGSGEWAQFITEKHFNLAELNALRALLDDIAKETGERIYKGKAEGDDQPRQDVKLIVTYEDVKPLGQE